MTDGTSQGLFIVVAIVIFGIFVALSYQVFGNQLSPGIQGMFRESTAITMRSSFDGENLLDMGNLRSFWSYHTNPEVDGNSFSVTLIRDNPLIAVRDNFGNDIFTQGNVYTVSGYALRNGEPLTQSDWWNEEATTYQEPLNFYVNDETGYFESTMRWVSETHRDYFLHTRIGTMNEGDIFTFNDIKVEEGHYATRREFNKQ